MAMNNLRVGILLSMGVRGLGAFKKAGGGLSGLATSAKAVRGEFALLAAQEAFAFMGDALRTFAQFDHSMKKVQAVTASTGQELENLTNLARQLGRDFPFTASEAADAMFELSLAGLKVNEVMVTTETVLKMAMAGNMGLAQSARIAVATMNAYGLAAEDVGFIGDQMTAGFTNSAMTLAELGAGLSFVGPVAKLANVSLADSVSTLGMFANAGIAGARSGTTFRQMLSKMLDPTTDAIQRMNELGLQFVDTSGQLLPMIDIVQQLIDAQMTANDVITVFGIRAAPGVGALINQGVEGFEELSGAIQDSEGELDRIADTMESSAQNEFKKFTSAMEDFKIQVGVQLMPVVNELIALFRGEEGLGVALTNLVVAFSGVFMSVAQLVAGFAPLIAILADVTGFIARHNDLLEILMAYLILTRGYTLAAAAANLAYAAATGVATGANLNFWSSLMLVAKRLVVVLALYLAWDGIIWSIHAGLAAIVGVAGQVVNSVSAVTGVGSADYGGMGTLSFSGLKDYVSEKAGPRPGWDSVTDKIGYADGGLVPTTGWYKLHAGELVKRHQALEGNAYDGEGSNSGTTNLNLTVNAMSTSPLTIANTVGKELQRYAVMTKAR